MTNNPIRSGTASVSMGRSEPRPGETITISIKTMDGKDTGRSLVFTRTDRPYVEDLCDAYNANRTRKDMEWYVTASGELKLRPAYDHDSTWREWKPEPGEIEATHDVVARAINAGLSMDQWREFVRNGTVTREVQKAMAERNV